jgi:hypothetical protein
MSGPQPGRRAKTSGQRVARAQRVAEAMRMRIDGKRYDEICAALGYNSTAAAAQDVTRAMAETLREPADDLRALELHRLDEAWQRLNDARNVVLEVMARRHVTVSNGRVVTLNDEPIEDDAPILQAIDRLNHIEDRRLRIQERRAKYLGLDAPKQVVITDDAIDSEIRALAEELDRAAAVEAAGTETPTG